MSFDRSYYPTVPSLQQNAQRVWAIARLHREGALDRLAGLQSLDAIYTATEHAPLRRLCETVAFRMFPEVDRPQPDVEPIVEVYAR
jgi:hypothetical protein